MRQDHTYVVLAYKENPFLEDCIISLERQSTRSPILLATSTPNDHIAAIAARHGLTVTVNPDRRGIGADWNFALAATQTQYVTLAHQDDLYDPRFGARSLSAIAVTPSAAISFTNARQIDDRGAARSSKVSLAKDALLRLFAGNASALSGRRARLLLSFGNPVSCSTITFNRAIVPDFRFVEDLSSNLDWDAWVRLVDAGHTLAYVPDRLVGRRYNDLTETSHLLRTGRRGIEDRMMFERLWPKPVAELVSRVYALGY
ncbi:MAG TPA: glycosyltransferase [Hyphomicrobiaceae bacterium]|nr:glycosyltransferase [Hyphomicrobiaceae bacterium]